MFSSMACGSSAAGRRGKERERAGCDRCCTGRYRQILAVSECAKEDKASWTAFLRELKERGLKGVKLFVFDKCLGLVENLAEFYPEAQWQR
jgi:hypothetical protein